jgi:hypothetical protein
MTMMPIPAPENFAGYSREDHFTAFSRRPAHIRARFWPPDHDTPFVEITTGDDQMTFTGIILVERDEPYEEADDFDRAFTLFSLDDAPEGEFLTIYGWNCHVDRL